MECCNQEMQALPCPDNEHQIHLICSVCSSHFYLDRIYTQDDWFFLVTENMHWIKECDS